MSISDRIAIMHAGRIEQIGTPEEIYEHPMTRYVASFIGNPQIDLVPARIETGPDGPAVVMAGLRVKLPDEPGRFADGLQIDWGIRPEHVRLVDDGTPAKVRMVQPVGPATHVTVDWEGGSLIASTPGFVRLPVGSAVHFELPPERLLVFDRESGRRL